METNANETATTSWQIVKSTGYEGLISLAEVFVGSESEVVERCETLYLQKQGVKPTKTNQSFTALDLDKDERLYLSYHFNDPVSGLKVKQ